MERVQGWAARFGLPEPHLADLMALTVAAVAVAAAYAIGWFAGRRLGGPLARRMRWWTGRQDGFGEAATAAVLGYGTAGLLLLVVANAGRLGAVGMPIVAVALGVAAAMLVARAARAIGVAAGIAAALALAAFVAMTAAMLGGMQPLVQGLGRVGLSVSGHRVTLLGVIDFVVVAAVLYALARVANRVAVHSIGRVGALDASQQLLAQKLASIAVVVIAVLLGIDLLGIDLTALTVFSGAAGLAIGFGLQTTFGNLIAGLILLMDRSVKPGDVIVVGDTFGQVTKIGVRAVSVATRDGKEHILPNQTLMTDPVENWSYTNRKVRVHIKVGVGYGSDLAVAQRLMIEAAMASPRALKDPKPTVWLTDFGDSSVDHEILVWITDPEAGVGNVRSDVLNRLWVSFKESGIELPFPQRDVHIRSDGPAPS